MRRGGYCIVKLEIHIMEMTWKLTPMIAINDTELAYIRLKLKHSF